MTDQLGRAPLTAEERLVLARDLEARRSQAPADLAAAHELGRLYYELATTSSGEADVQGTVGYWTKVIANWALVLEDDAYWEGWVAERAQVYGVPISQKSGQTARERLWHLLLADLHRYDRQAEACLPYHESLAIQMQLETAAIRQLRQFSARPDVGDAAVPLYGPLLLKELGQEQTLARFIATQVRRHGRSDNLVPMLQSLSGELEPEELSAAEQLGQLMLSYSQLGGALVYVQQQQSAAAVQFLRHVQCPACSPLAARATTSDGKRAIEICHADCAAFARNNPAYSALADGWNRLWADTIRLAIEVCILGARDLLGEDEPDVPEVRSLWKGALNLAWYDELAKQVRQRISDSVQAQVAALKQAGKWQRAAQVLEAAGDVIDTESGQLVGERVKLLDSSAIARAKEHDWAGATADLRTAYGLNPASDRVRDHLVFCLEREAEQLAAAASHAAAREVLGEAERIVEQWLAEESHETDPERMEQLEGIRFKLGFAYRDFWQQSALFARAIAEAKRLEQHYLGVEHLFLSLTKVERGLTQQTLYDLGIAPVVLRNEIRHYVGVGDDEQYWAHVHFTPRLRRVLLRAIELAHARDSSALDEPDFLYAIVGEPDCAPLQVMLALGLPMAELPHWQPAGPTGPCPTPRGATVLTYLSGPEDGKVVYSTRPILALGRAEENDVRLGFDRRVSRRHARLTVNDRDFTLEDLDSSVGTYVEDRTRVTVPTRLTPGARFKVGQTWIRIDRA